MCWSPPRSACQICPTYRLVPTRQEQNKWRLENQKRSFQLALSRTGQATQSAHICLHSVPPTVTPASYCTLTTGTLLPSQAQQFGTRCLTVCVTQLLDLTNFAETWRHTSLPDLVIHLQRIRGVSRNALYKSTFTYLLTYFSNSFRRHWPRGRMQEIKSCGRPCFSTGEVPRTTASAGIHFSLRRHTAATCCPYNMATATAV